MSFLASSTPASGCEVTLIEGVPGHLAELSSTQARSRCDGATGGFSDRLEVRPLYRERFCVPFRWAIAFGRRTGFRIPMSPERPFSRGSIVNIRTLNERCREHGFAVQIGFRSEREDWIQMMVAAGSASALSGVFADHPRRPHSARCRPGSRPTGLAWCRSPAGVSHCRRRLRRAIRGTGGREAAYAQCEPSSRVLGWLSAAPGRRTSWGGASRSGRGGVVENHAELRHS